jgi:TPP-dependent pyruvate/acetoin dehydrogenase alpha subunit
MKSKDKEQQRTEAEPAMEGEGFSLISNAKLLALYGILLKCRRLAECAGELGVAKSGFGAALGWEAAAAGVAIDLRAEDTLAAGPGNLTPALVKGAPLEFFAEFLLGLPSHPSRKNKDASRVGRPRRYAVDQSPVGPANADLTLGFAPLNVFASTAASAAPLNIATGVALANKIQGNGRVAAAFCGEGRQALDLWREAFEFAGSHDLPILFVCQNRDGETEEPGQISADELGERAEAWKIPAIPVDGSDVVAVYRVAYESIARARLGRGPTVIDCRIQSGGKEHAEADSDPIWKMEAYLAGKGLFREDAKREVLAGFEKELDTVIAGARISPPASAHSNPTSSIRERTLNRKPWKLKF